MPPLKNRQMSDTLKKIAEKRGMMIPRTVTVKKPMPADSKTPDTGAYLSDRIQGSYNPNNPDNKMKKSLDNAPYYYDHRWDESGNYGIDKKHLIKKT